ncbi:hypothetical protein [Corynebacterium crudilactis]|uniref:Uncharacterized protein n=1 Tax=Corynebacterium crudilactis TaxID=1652495 RepID=A0A172QR98_9CORY|nr:hypothetical protein [Corynebacterium crudilactis]ANE03198.1 hypothetical protein ccrud_02560 [Corynebacterium crudilactis]
MWKLSIGIAIGAVLLALGLWGTHAENSGIAIAGWVGSFAAFAVWFWVIWRAAVGNVKSPL